MLTQFNGFHHICITQKSNKGWWLNQRPVCKFYRQYLNILIWKKYDEFFPTTINYCSVRGKRVFFRGKREWCWTRAGGRISRGWKLSLQHLESAELQAADREKNSGGGGFSARGGCKQFRTRRESCKVEGEGHIWCLFAFQDFLIYSFAL